MVNIHVLIPYSLQLTFDYIYFVTYLPLYYPSVLSIHLSINPSLSFFGRYMTVYVLLIYYAST